LQPVDTVAKHKSTHKPAIIVLFAMIVLFYVKVPKTVQSNQKIGEPAFAACHTSREEAILLWHS